MDSLDAHVTTLDLAYAMKSPRRKLTSMTAAELKELMTQLRLTQEQLARAIGVSTSAVAKWCQGKSRVPGPVGILLRKMAAEHHRKRKTKEGRLSLS
jgi:DNA-binding transcriptional regulator YiaG